VNEGAVDDIAEVAERIAAVRRRIAEAAGQARRDPAEVRLLAVSKTMPAGAVRSAYASGIRDFGENYVQELRHKAQMLADLPDLRWHLIGHLQRNKARHAAQLVSVVHTLDSAELARELGRRVGSVPEVRRFSVGARASGDRLPVLVEVNLGGEQQKAGCEPSELAALLTVIECEPRLELGGLMTVPPATDDPAGARPFFEQLAELREQHGGAGRLPELSMGMTQDLEVAVIAGATIVRVGSAIFGARPTPEPG
jgi:pyridoxal phosphate enzyme (YggS family)